MSAATQTLRTAVSQKTALLFLLKNIINEQGQRCYVYFAVRLDHVPAFIYAARTHGGVYDLESFGKVLAGGPGDTPSENDYQMLERDFGFKHAEAVVLN